MNRRIDFGVLREAGSEGGSGAGGSGSGSAGGGSLIAGGSAGAGAASGAASGAGGGSAANGGGSGVIAEPFWKGYFREDGSLDGGRLDKLPDDLKDAKPYLSRLGKVEDLFKSYVHAQKLVSQKGLMPLRENATEAERNEHLALLRKVNGAPDKPDGYGLKKPEGLPDELWSDERVKKFAEVFHKYAIPPAAVAELVNLDTSEARALMETSETDRINREMQYAEQQKGILKAEFGLLYDRKIQDAQRGAKWLGLDPEDASLFRDARLVMAMAKAGEKLSESDFVDGSGGGSGAGDSAQAELDAISRNPDHKYHKALLNANHPLYSEAVEYRRRLARRVAAEQSSVASRR